MVRWFLLSVFILFVPAVSAAGKSILVLGDSLSAGYGIAEEQGWVALLQERLASQGYSYDVVNASISGDTTSGAHARLDDLLLVAQPEIAIIELGGNDGLRGLPVEEMYQNLSRIISRILEFDTRVLLIPIQLPPNYGQVYTARFGEVYQRLADSYDVVKGRFLLEGIALDPELMQDDGIHPKADAQMQILDNIWPYLQPMLDATAINSNS
jgi:acyl-CoA thioesterase-1